jgi:toluene monooxygenase system protein A
MRLLRHEWLDLSRKLDWSYSYVEEQHVFPEAMSGRPWLAHAAWEDWDEPYRTSFAEYVSAQHEKEAAIGAVREAVGGVGDFARHDRAWLSALKLHAATLPLAEFAAVLGNLRAARFGRDGAWRTMAALGALDELRHTQIPLAVLHDLVAWDAQFDFTHRLFHTDGWVAIAARHFVDELLLGSNPVEFAVATNFVFETGFTNLQFVGLSAVAHAVGDRMFEKMLQSIQTDEARHAQIGGPVLKKLCEHDPGYAQFLVDKWFWRSFHFFAVVTGFAMDYLTPLAQRKQSFREFMDEWVLGQFERTLEEYGLARPFYWDEFVASLDYYHHQAYASAYTYRATLWFDVALPSPEERAWLAEKYPRSWPELAPVWARITERWEAAGPEVEWFTHGVTPIGLCSLCQFPLCAGTPRRNSARVVEREGRRLIFCSEPCRHFFEQEPERYAAHETVVERILAGKAPANLIALVRDYFGLSEAVWGKDAARGRYGWLARRDTPGSEG